MKNNSYLLFVCVVATIIIWSSVHIGVVSNQESLALVKRPTDAKSASVVQKSTGKTKEGVVFQFTKPIYFGEDSPSILALQMFLKEQGFLSVDKETTYFGQLTRNALISYQKSQGFLASGSLDETTLNKVNIELRELASVPSGVTCSAYSSAASVFPPSPGTPPLPGRDTHPYTPETYDCDNFAMNFCERLKKVDPGVDCSTLIFDSHMIDIIEYVDSSGVAWVCVVEPQSNEFYCMKKSEWNNLPDGWKKWVQDVMCQEYYLYSKEECKVPVSIQKYYGACSDIIGTSCEGGGWFPKLGYCSDPSYNPPPRNGDNKGYKSIFCDCEQEDGQPEICKWRQHHPYDDTPTIEPPASTTPPITPTGLKNTKPKIEPISVE